MPVYSYYDYSKPPPHESLACRILYDLDSSEVSDILRADALAGDALKLLGIKANVQKFSCSIGVRVRLLDSSRVKRKQLSGFEYGKTKEGRCYMNLPTFFYDKRDAVLFESQLYPTKLAAVRAHEGLLEQARYNPDVRAQWVWPSRDAECEWAYDLRELLGVLGEERKANIKKQSK